VGCPDPAATIVPADAVPARRAPREAEKPKLAGGVRVNMDHGGDNGRGADSRASTSETPGTASEPGKLRATATAKAIDLRRTAVVKGGELRSTAATKGGELGRSAATRGAEIRRNMRNMDVPWARCAPARVVRETILQFGLRPLMSLYTRLFVFGRERFDDVAPPVVFVANHSSHLDTPTILRALPLKWRQHTAVAAAADYFYKKRLVAHAVALVFNTVPIMRRGGGGAGEGAFDHVDRLIDARWNLLMFPEGTRSRDGQLGRLKSGAAVIAQRHGIPIIPVRVKGTHDAMPPGQNWPKRVRGLFSRRHRLEVHFGPMIAVPASEDPADVMERVRSYLEDAAGHGLSGSNGNGTGAGLEIGAQSKAVVSSPQ
jgi:1-acyl-sn-glycerol-3-phosphate acyltransferase